MIDTMYLFFKITKIDYNSLYKKIEKLSSKHHKPFYPSSKGSQYSRYVTICLMNHGIMELALTHNTKDFDIHLIEIKLHPKVMLEAHNYHDVSSLEDLLEVRNIFKRHMKSIDYDLPDLFDWSCKRIDYAVNIQTPHVTEYLTLFKRGNIARYFLGSIGKMLQYDGSFYVTTKNKDLTINFYDKYDQAKKRMEGITYYNLTNLTGFEHILRLEIQCGKKKLERLKSYFSLPNACLNNYIKPDIAYHVIAYYYNLVTGNCNEDFLSYEQIKKRLLKNNSLSEAEIMNIASFFAAQESSQGLWDIRKQFYKKDAHFHKALSQIRKCGLHPLLIPKNLSIDNLPNLNKEIKEQIFNSKKIIRL